MSDTAVLAIVAAVPATIAAIGSIVAIVVNHGTSQSVDATRVGLATAQNDLTTIKVHTNAITTKLADASQQLGHAQGVADERARTETAAQSGQ